jgi:hypothetical protein
MNAPRRIGLASLLVWASLEVLGSPAAHAQLQAPVPSVDCPPPSASRAAPKCEPTPTQTKFELETKLDVTLELPEQKMLQCSAAIEVEYSQRDTVAGVALAIDTKDCAAASGEYKVIVSVRNEALELTTLEFAETWQRLDVQPVIFKKDYPIGENVDLVRVRTRGVSCTCAESPVPPR